MEDKSMFKNAKLEKLKELKKLIYELMSGEGMEMDETISPKNLKDVMEESSEEVMEGIHPESEEKEEGEPLTELRQMQKDYFKPKAKERRPGTAIMFGSVTAKPMKKAPEAPIKASKKARY